MMRLAQREDPFASLEEMRDNLRETLKETALLRNVVFEEEVLIRAENIDKTCTNALRQTRYIRGLLKSSAASGHEKRSS